MHFCPIFFEHCVKKPNHWFYLCKKCTIKMCIFIQKRHMSFGKKPQLIKWFNLLLLKLTPPQKLLYKPRLFYSNHPIHRNIELWTTSTTWTPAGLSSPGPSSTITRSSTTGCWIPPQPRGQAWGQAIIAEHHLWKAVVTKEASSPPPILLEELAKGLDSPKQDGASSLVNRDPFCLIFFITSHRSVISWLLFV